MPAHDPGSGITIFDGGPLRDDGHGGTAGTNPPPPADVPNRDGEDPHEGPRASVCGRIQKSDFLRQDGAVTDPCPGPKLDQGYAGEAAPDKVLPEAPYAAMLPVLALAVLAGGVALRRRRRPVEAARAVR